MMTSCHRALTRRNKERSGSFDDLALFFRAFLELVLPFGAVHGGSDLDCRHLRRHEIRFDEQSLAAHELIDVHDRRAHRRFVVARPLYAADLT